MKNIYKSILFLFSLALMVSCEGEKFNVPFEYEDGGWIKFEETPVFSVNVADMSSSEAVFNATLVDPIGNAATYDLYVSATINGTAYEDKLVTTITEFPAQLSIAPSDLATALGVDLSELGGGNIFSFYAVVTTTDGTVYEAEPVPNFDADGDGYNGGNISETLLEEGGYRNAFVFNVSYLCPFVVEDAVGSYEVVYNHFGPFFQETLQTREVIAGPGENQITIVEGVYPGLGSDPLILTVDSDTGMVTEINEDGLSITAYGGNNYQLISGTVYSCSGYIDLFLDFAGGINGNPHQFIIQKVD
ncbi:hypothetical protein [Gramella sp. KN1008]|uniref:hypothetical protein n=1 Tax=Gramella sp. KN1008 TaxID=2529298 RepID=UPI00103C66F4|nr:hypothetical protein [Gramella sp. KN1008]TBW25877.1 hypothetical protein EZJ28_14690 [Gramella sp. KN1008]